MATAGIYTYCNIFAINSMTMNRFLFFLSIVSCSANAQIVDIPDAEFRSRLTALGVDNNSNGQFEVSEVQNVTMLDLDNDWTDDPQIYSLAGIGFFTNLVELHAQYHSISSLDVTMLNNLEVLDLWNNNLNSINVSTNIALEVFSCGYNNLADIDVSALSNLRYLNCDGNQLTDLNVLNNPHLQFLDAGENFLTGIVINHLQELQLVRLIDNQIASINLENIGSLGSWGLQFDISKNPIETIDATQGEITQITCNDCPNLKHVLAKNNMTAVCDPDMLFFGFVFWDSPQLEFICADESDECALMGTAGLYPDLEISYTDCELSLNEVETSGKLTVTPNPIGAFAQITSDADIAHFELFDLSGKSLFIESEKTVAEGKLQSLKAGFYIFKVKSATGSNVMKILKE